MPRLREWGRASRGLTEADARKISAALDAGQPIVAEVKYRGLTPAGELRRGSLMAWTAA